MDLIGFPIVEAYPDGKLIITKHENLGGLVDERTIKEQLLYELGDPKEYITPDVVADFTTIHLESIGKNKVLVKDIKGRPSTEFYKVSVSYSDGYTCIGGLTYVWPDALKKAKKADVVDEIDAIDPAQPEEVARREGVPRLSGLVPVEVQHPGR